MPFSSAMTTPIAHGLNLFSLAVSKSIDTNCIMYLPFSVSSKLVFLSNEGCYYPFGFGKIADPNEVKKYGKPFCTYMLEKIGRASCREREWIEWGKRGVSKDR